MTLPVGPPPVPLLVQDLFVVTDITAGNTYTLTRTPLNNGFLLGLFYNGVLLIQGMHYAVGGRTITLTFATTSGDNLYAEYQAGTYS